MKKIGLALAFAAAIALSFAGCSNSSDSGAAAAAAGAGTGSGTGAGTNTGTENGGGTQTTPTTQPGSAGGNQQGGATQLPAKPWLKAEAVDGGIKFTIKALGAQYNNENDCFIYSQQPSDIGRFYPEWNDKTKEWTGVYPYVTAGIKYAFKLHVGNLQEEQVEVTPTSGSGQIQYDAQSVSAISVDSSGINIVASKCPPSVVPNEATNKKVCVAFFAGVGWDNVRQIWDATWLDILEKPDLAQPGANENCQYTIDKSEALYKKLKGEMTGTHSGKKMFVEFTYRYKVAGFAAECHSRQLRSVPVDCAWD